MGGLCLAPHKAKAEPCGCCAVEPAGALQTSAPVAVRTSRPMVGIQLFGSVVESGLAPSLRPGTDFQGRVERLFVELWIRAGLADGLGQCTFLGPEPFLVRHRAAAPQEPTACVQARLSVLGAFPEPACLPEGIVVGVPADLNRGVRRSGRVGHVIPPVRHKRCASGILAGGRTGSAAHAGLIRRSPGNKTTEASRSRTEGA